MKILLTAVNAKYIHSNLAVHSLKAYAQSFCDSRNIPNNTVEICIAEYTINQKLDDILADIYRRKPDMLCLSCYIWNIAYIEELIREIKKVMPALSIWLGGPEVSYDAEELLLRLPEADGVMKGEGEETFAELAAGKNKKNLDGITYRDESGMVVENAWRSVMDLNKVPFVYQNMKEFEHKIIYYESSRGCPFSCSYCLSSIDKRLRFRDAGLVIKELKFFLDHKVPQVKFVDRTFNCSHAHALAIWRYLYEHDNGITNFHFEVSADLLNQEEIRLIRAMRPGLLQLEIGVQSTNPAAIREINRTMQFKEVSRIVKEINENHNVHLHLDLIAGLPYEDIQSFAKSFNDVYELRPSQLQLGFLKVLKGSGMFFHKEIYGLGFKNMPPYEVMYTKWLSYDDILKLKDIEAMVEIYYNSGQFGHTLKEMERHFPSPFKMYESLSLFYKRQGYEVGSHKRAERYEILLAFAQNIPETKESIRSKTEKYRELLVYDYYLRENAKSRPVFAGPYSIEKKELWQFYEQEVRERKYLPEYAAYDKNQMRRMTHLERFDHLGEMVLFDYAVQDPVTGEARTSVICRKLSAPNML